MRLIDCYIENFGMLSGYSRVFTEGVNTIYADNGDGKTTLSVFIKSMLYGLDDTKARSLEENDRKMYLPWQGGVCGGSLTFEYGGKVYRIERTFGKKASEDTVKVVLKETGDRVPELESRLGEKIFGIDRVGFEATVFLSEKNITLNESNSATVQQKLSDVVGADGATDAYDKAIKMLEDESRILKNKRGGAGEIADTARRIGECEDEIRHIEAKMLEEKLLESDIKALEAELSTLVDKRRVLSDAIESERQKEGRRAIAAQYNSFLDREAEAKRELEAKLAFFKEGGRSEDELSEIERAESEARVLTEEIKHAGSSELQELRDYFMRETSYAEIADMEAKLKAADEERASREALLKKIECETGALRKRLGGEIPEIGMLEEIKRKISGKGRSPISLLMALVGGAMLIGGGVTLLLPDMLILAAALIGVGLVLATVGIVLLVRGGNGKPTEDMVRLGIKCAEDTDALIRDVKQFNDSTTLDREKIAAAERKIAEVEAEVAAYLDSYKTEGILYSDRLREVRARYEVYYDLKTKESIANAALESKELRRSYLIERVRQYVARYPTSSDNPLEEIRAAIKICRTLEDRVKMLSEEREDYRLKNAITEEDLSEVGRASRIGEIDENILLLDTEMKTVRDRLVLKREELKGVLETVEAYDEAIARRNMLTEKRDASIARFEIIKKTAELLSEAATTMTGRYIGKTRERFAHYESLIGMDPGEFSISLKFKLSRLDRGATRDMESYSRGTQDLHALALRLALVDSLYTADVPPIILDDPFTAFDDKRLAGAKRALLEIGKERQIIYFTCSSSRVI